MIRRCLINQHVIMSNNNKRSNIMIAHKTKMRRQFSDRHPTNTTTSISTPVIEKMEQKIPLLKDSVSNTTPVQEASSSVASESSSSSSFFRRSWNNGNLLLFVGYSGLAIWLIDRYLQYDQSRTKRNAQQLLLSIQEETVMKRRELYENNYKRIALYQCTVIEVYKNMGGFYGLQNINTNDIIDIIEENVGPDEYYHLCRTYEYKDDTKMIKSIGWYPKKYLHRIETKRNNI